MDKDMDAIGHHAAIAVGTSVFAAEALAVILKRLHAERAFTAEDVTHLGRALGPLEIVAGPNSSSTAKSIHETLRDAVRSLE